MLAGIKEILIISTPPDTPRFRELLGSGNQWGINLQYAVQPSPDGLAQTFIIGRSFVDNSPIALILGDNLFCGAMFHEQLQRAAAIGLTTPNYGTAGESVGATVFAYAVSDPERYGVVTFDAKGKAISIEEKPKQPASRYAVTGLYLYDNQVCDMVHDMKPSARGELEITDVNKIYLEKSQLKVEIMGRGMAWLDTGTHDSLIEAGQFIQVLQKRQGKNCLPRRSCLEEGLDNRFSVENTCRASIKKRLW